MSGRSAFNITIDFDLCPTPQNKDDPQCITPPATEDGYWIGLFLEGEDPTKVVPFTFQNLEDVPGFNTDARGSLFFHAVNMRKNFVAKLFAKGGAGKTFPHLQPSSTYFLGDSNIIAVTDVDCPQQRRVSYHGHGDDKKLIITWTAGEHADQALMYRVAPKKVPLLTRWLSVDDDNWSRVEAQRDVYTSDDMCAPPATTTGWREFGATYFAELPNFDSDTAIQYSVGGANCTESHPCEDWTEVTSVHQPPRDDEKVRAFVFGDMGEYYPDDSVKDFTEASYAVVGQKLNF